MEGVHAGECMAMLVLLGFLGMMVMVTEAASDYGQALKKSILFFEGQRSGKLPSNQRMSWRKDSALKDGSDVHMNLVGGYYDAGDNIKFTFPMAFTTTMLAWSVIEFGQFMGSDLTHALEAIRWGSDFLLKATNKPETVVAQVGEPIADHNCWERPEDMDTPRNSYIVNKTHPGSEVSAEIAAALAASSIAFRSVDKRYSATLLGRAYKVFQFANEYQGSYNLSIGDSVCPFYCDFSGYKDELLWGAAWLHKASPSNRNYWNFVQDGIDTLGGSFAEFGWDTKHAGIYILFSGFPMQSAHSSPFLSAADNFVCSVLPESPTKSVTYSKGGLMFKPGSSNLQHATSISFLLIVYARYLNQAGRQVNCGHVVASPSRLVQVAKTQVDYILGSNPEGMSYMVGYGRKYPQRIHHRASALPSVAKHPASIQCHDGTPYYQSRDPNPNVLVGAVVGGPDDNDQYADNRADFSQSEPTTYINAPLVGVLSYFKAQKGLEN